MKIFLLKLTLFSGLLIIIVQLMALTIRATGNDPYANYVHQFKQFRQLNTAPSALSLGNSHAGAIDFDTLGMEGFHLWLSSGDLKEAEYIVKSILEETPAIKIVFLNISYFSFRYDNAVIADRHQRRKWLYSVVDSWSFIPGDRGEFIAGNFNTIIPSGTVVESAKPRVMQTLLGITERKQGPFLAADGQRADEKYVDCFSFPSYEALSSDALERASMRHHNDMQEMLRGNPDIVSESYQALESIIQLVEANDAQLILYTPPYFAAYSEVFDSEIIEEMKVLVQNLTDNYAAVYYDYSLEPLIAERYELFFNSHHLNLCGAQLFSKQLSSKLQNKVTPRK